jgi:AcrR family transcriptional regulator
MAAMGTFTGLSSVAHGRRTNPERSAATRAHILDATVQCLHLHGYGAVTNHRLSEMANVSRGAVLHHFPARQDLMVAVISHARNRQIEYTQQRLAEIPEGLPRLRALIDLAWERQRLPEGLALIEIRMGARSDPEIAAAVRPHFLRIADDYGRFVGRIVREAGLESDDEMKAFQTTMAMAMRALAIDRFTHPKPEMVDMVHASLRATLEGIIERQLARKSKS